MDIHSNLEYLCRVCAANTKGKNSVAECVYIIKTAGLKDKLDKFLYLKISENDSLPKVLCKSCFRQVEATASLSKIAKHTQQVFRDFLLSNLPKGPSVSTNTSEFTSSDFMGNKGSNESSKRDDTVIPSAPPNSLVHLPPPPPPTPTPAPAPAQLLPPPPPPPSLATASRKDEVVVNVSVADPLTRDNQQKMISNSQRRQSLLIEPRFTPKSIAQKPVPTTTTTTRPIAPKPNLPTETVNTTNTPKLPVVSSLNFYPVKPQQPQQLPTQITTFSSGGYVIGRINADKEEPKKITVSLAPNADNILQQKRKNLVKALNNIKANSSGQVSLLKSSQQKQAEAMQNSAKTPLSEAVGQAAEDELPDKIIIAAPKRRTPKEKSKKEPLNLSKIPATVTPLPTASSLATITALMEQQQQQQQDQSNAFNASLPKPAFPEDIVLGNVIRDMDLLKLILKALQWPVNKQNMETQLTRLKNSKFIDIISDTNLLQDTDLIQLLGPYLAPVLMAAQALQQQHQQQVAKNTALNQSSLPANVTTQPTKMTALEAAQAEINKSIPYKLPPETSVQLVPATPEETETTPSPSSTHNMNNTTSSTAVALKRDRQKDQKDGAANQKRQRRTAAQKARDSIVISDEEDASTETQAPKKSKRSNKAQPKFHIELNPNFMSQLALLNGSSLGGASEADELMALLMKQKAAIMSDKKVQRRRRNSVSSIVTLPPSEFDALIDLDDDIVLMEPVTTTTTSSSTTTSSEATSSNQEPQQQKFDVSNTFAIPSIPLITRPIIKRRKTVIHPPKNRYDLSFDPNNKDLAASMYSTSAFIVRNKEKLMEETINQVATGNITNIAEDTTTQPSPPSKLANNEAGANVVAPPELMVTKPPQQKKSQNKSALGQQLLEAIGLQQMPNQKMANDSPAETNSSAKLPTNITLLPNKESVQQLRTALKKSLKQAQEQQQQKKRELTNNTIIQDADSTTKPAIKEIVVVEGKGNKSNSCSSLVDVEEEIDKVTLVLRKNDEEKSEQSTTTKAINSVKEGGKKDMKKSSPAMKIQERRRTLLPTNKRIATVSAHNMEDKEKSNEDDKQKEIVETTGVENVSLQKDDSANISSSSGAISNGLNEEATTATADNDEIVIVRKKRGRKRLVDKLLELEAAAAIEREKAEKMEKTDLSDDEAETTNQESESNTTTGRPARQSKKQSKYYKGPDKPAQGRRALPSRTTRNRKYC